MTALEFERIAKLAKFGMKSLLKSISPKVETWDVSNTVIGVAFDGSELSGWHFAHDKNHLLRIIDMNAYSYNITMNTTKRLEVEVKVIDK